MILLPPLNNGSGNNTVSTQETRPSRCIQGEETPLIPEISGHKKHSETSSNKTNNDNKSTTVTETATHLLTVTGNKATKATHQATSTFSPKVTSDSNKEICKVNKMNYQ